MKPPAQCQWSNSFLIRIRVTQSKLINWLIENLCINIRLINETKGNLQCHFVDSTIFMLFRLNNSVDSLFSCTVFSEEIIRIGRPLNDSNML